MYTYIKDIQYRYSNPKYEVNFIDFKRQKPMENYCCFYAGASELTLSIATLLREIIPYSRI